MKSWYYHRQSIVLTILLMSAAIASPARDVVHAPAPVGGMSAVARQDLALPSASGARFSPSRPAAIDEGRAAAKAAGDILGGDDVDVTAEPGMHTNNLAIASNGDIYVAMQANDPVEGLLIHVYRSVDSGATFTSWGDVIESSPTEQALSPSLHLVEGDVSRCYIAYSRTTTLGGGESLLVAWNDLADATATFTNRRVVLTGGSDSFRKSDLTSDVVSFSTFYLYLVAESSTASTSEDIWFARSTDFGDTWETPYKIGDIPQSDRGYRYPQVSYGFGGVIHVGWTIESHTGAFDKALRYRKVPNYANGGQASWNPIVFLTSASDGLDQQNIHLAAATTNSSVAIVADQIATYYQEPRAYVSTDGGTSFLPPVVLGTESARSYDLVYLSGVGAWRASFGIMGKTIYAATAASPTNWSEYGTFNLDDYQSYAIDQGSNVIAPDPSRGEQLGLISIRERTGETVFKTVFDAEWHGGEGWPNLEPGFPVTLVHAPVSDPALVDLDGDGTREIVFGDSGAFVRVYRSDGSILPGWPRYTTTISDSPIAVGAVTLAGDPYVAVGTASGRVRCYKGNGDLLWSRTVGSGPVYTTIGAVGGPFPRTIITASGTQLMLLNHDGTTHAAAPGMTIPSGSIDQPPAVGDVDGDGVAEVAFTYGSTLMVYDVATDAVLFSRTFTAPVSDAVTIGDMNLDGDLEIAVPLTNGELHLVDATGSEMPGWPFMSPSGYPLRSAAWANVLGGSQPELAVASQNAAVHLLYGTGVEQSGYPAATGAGWYLFGNAVVAGLEGFSSDVVIGSRDQSGWAFDNFGAGIAGWPKSLGDYCHWTPAVGDIDGDGRNEVVFLTASELRVYDVFRAPQPLSNTRWAMSGHDAQRTGCYECIEDLTTTVDGAVVEGSVRVSFAAPRPNPTTGATVFNFTLPRRAAVGLEVLDVRGRRVRMIERAEMSAGTHTLGWDGRGDDGRPAGSGTYYARLQVRGPGQDAVQTRKVTIVR